MTRLSEESRTGQSSQSVQPERRRPGRQEDVNPALIPLLRRKELLEGALAQRDGDDLAPVKGIAVSAVIGALFWGGVLALAWWVFAD